MIGWESLNNSCVLQAVNIAINVDCFCREHWKNVDCLQNIDIDNDNDFFYLLIIWSINFFYIANPLRIAFKLNSSDHLEIQLYIMNVINKLFLILLIINKYDIKNGETSIGGTWQNVNPWVPCPPRLSARETWTPSGWHFVMFPQCRSPFL